MNIGSFSTASKKKSPLFFEPIRLAIELGDVKLCRALLEEAYNSDNGYFDYQCDTQFASSAKKKFGEHLQVTFADREAKIKGYKLFHYAASIGNVEILQILFEKASSEIIHCCQPVHPIHLAVAGGHGSCVDLIIDEARRGNTIFPSF